MAAKHSLDCHKAVRRVDHSCGAVDLPDEPYRDDAACSGGSQDRPFHTDPGVLRWRREVPDLAAVDMWGKVGVAAGVGSQVCPQDTDRRLLRIAQGSHARMSRINGMNLM